MKRKALGRGLSAILSDLPKPEKTNKVVESISVDRIVANHLQPRSDFDQKQLNDLSASIKEQGVLQPLLVRKHPDREGFFQLIAGERRLRASKIAELEEVPCIVLEAEETEMLEIALIENVQRSDLNPIDEARAYKHLAERFTLTQEEISKRVGKSRESIANSLRLLNLPSEVLDRLESGSISVGHAKSLLALQNDSRAIHLTNQIIDQGLSVRETERKVRELNSPQNSEQQSKTPQQKPEKDIYIQELENALENRFQTKVEVNPKGNKGTILFHYYDLDQLEGILEKWNIDIK